MNGCATARCELVPRMYGRPPNEFAPAPLALLAREPAPTHQQAKSHAEAQSHGDEPDDVRTMQPLDAGIIQAVEQSESSE
jgi:hypothetical protein